MRYVYTALIVLFTALVIVFKLQNLQSVTVVLLSMSVTLPLSLLIIAVYFLGMVTGGSLTALLRSWLRGARSRPR